MLDDGDDFGAPLSGDQAFELLRELEGNTPEQIRRQRAHFRVAIKAGVVVQPGNTSELLTMKVKGVSGDISEGGCSVLLPIPVKVGDVYRLTWDREAVDLGLTFARCVRCRLVREDAFEAGFAFFVSISLPEKLHSHTESALID